MKALNFVNIPKEYLSLKMKIDLAISKVIKSGHLILGEEVDLFEKEFADFLNAKYCLTVNSGTDALILGLRSLNLKPGDEVIVPTNTFIASALAATENKLTPIFVDVNKDDYGIDLADLKRKITTKTKAIIVVHLFGQPDKLDEIQKIIKGSKKNIYLIEDAAQAHGAFYNKKRIGTRGIFSVFSFYPTKNLGAYGDGGAIVTNNRGVADSIRLLRQYGQESKYHHEILGVNSRMDTIQAAILRIKLRHLDEWNNKRQANARLLTKLINRDCPKVKTPGYYKDRPSVYHLYVIQANKRNALQYFLKQKHIMTLVHYPIPLHLQKAFSYLKYKKGDFPNAENISDSVVSLPIHPFLTIQEIKYMARTITDFYKQK